MCFVGRGKAWNAVPLVAFALQGGSVFRGVKEALGIKKYKIRLSHFPVFIPGASMVAKSSQGTRSKWRMKRIFCPPVCPSCELG